MSKKASGDPIVEPDVNRDEWHAWTSDDGWATAFYMPNGERVVIKGRAAADAFQAANPEAELATATHNPGRTGSVIKVAWSIDQVRQVLDSGATKVDGMLLDHFSASALVQIFDALSPENQAKLEAMSLDRAMDVVWKLAAKHSGSVHASGWTEDELRTALGEKGFARYQAMMNALDDAGRASFQEKMTLASIVEFFRLMDEPMKYPWEKDSSLRSAGRPGDEAFDEYEKDDWDPRDGEPKYPELAEDDDDLFYEDFAHEASVSPFAVNDPTDIRPLHTRVAAAFLKKG